MARHEPRQLLRFGLEASAAAPSGAARPAGLDKLLSAQTGLPVVVADDPLSAVAEGTGVVMNELDFLARNRRAS